MRLQASACPFKRRMLGSPPDDLVTVGYGGKGTARHGAVVQTIVQNQMPFAENVDQTPELLAMTIEGHYDMTSCCSLLMKNVIVTFDGHREWFRSLVNVLRRRHLILHHSLHDVTIVYTTSPAIGSESEDVPMWTTLFSNSW